MARQNWHAGYTVVIITANPAVLGAYLATMVGFARVAYAMGRDGTLPAFLGRLHPRFQVPWNAQHIVRMVTVLMVAVLMVAVCGRWLGLYLFYDWRGSAVV